MADKTLIAWCHMTFNIAHGCMKVSAGCAHCYALELTQRRSSVKIWGPSQTTERRIFGDAHWKEPHRWNTAAEREGVTRLVFSSSMCDNFEEHPTIERELEKLWALIRTTPQLHWQLLTKRPERIAQLLPRDWHDHPAGYYPNVWLGTSIEDMRVAARADHLRSLPAAVRFISYEPALGPLDALDLTGIDLVIYGGESGPNFRPHDPAWPLRMRDRCNALGVAFFYKQSSARYTEQGIHLGGQLVRNFPTPRGGWRYPLARFDWMPKPRPAPATPSLFSS